MAASPARPLPPPSGAAPSVRPRATAAEPGPRERSPGRTARPAPAARRAAAGRAAGRYRAAARRRSHHRAADAEDRQPDGGVLRPRQDHRPHHLFDVAIDETVQFGALQVTPRVCYTRPPTETPNTDAFIEVDEVTLQGEVQRIFTGWMFAASPGLHGVEHPIYDVWLTDCKGGAPLVAEAPRQPAPPPRRAAAPRASRRAARAAAGARQRRSSQPQALFRRTGSWLAGYAPRRRRPSGGPKSCAPISRIMPLGPPA